MPRNKGFYLARIENDNILPADYKAIQDSKVPEPIKKYAEFIRQRGNNGFRIENVDLDTRGTGATYMFNQTMAHVNLPFRVYEPDGLIRLYRIKQASISSQQSSHASARMARD